MKHPILKTMLLLIFITAICHKTSAQFVQSINKKYGQQEADTSQERINSLKRFIRTNSTKEKNNREENNTSIDPYAAYRLSCIYNDSVKHYVSLQKGLDNISITDLKEFYNNALHYSKKIKDYTELRDSLRTLNALTGNPKLLRRFLPLRSVKQASYFYFDNQYGEKKIALVKDVLVQRNFDGSNSVNSNLLTGILPISAVPLKFTLGTSVTQPSDSTTEDKAKEKLPYGGFVNVGLSYPLFFSNTAVYGKSIVVYLPIESRLHIDDVKDGQEFKSTYYYNELSASLFTSFDLIQANDSKNDITLFTNLKMSFFSGGNKFKTKLENNNFYLLQLNGGIKIADRFTIGFNAPLFCSVKNIINKQSASIALIFEPNL